MKKRKGMDLVQLGIYAICIGILLMVIMPKLTNYVEGKKMDATNQEMRVLAEQCALYSSISAAGNPPSTLGDLVTGLTADQSVDNQNHNDFVADKGLSKTLTSDPTSFVDAWKNQYVYDAAARTITSTFNGKTNKTISF
jgi:type II secretory pathway pseudopilin PulG